MSLDVYLINPVKKQSKCKLCDQPIEEDEYYYDANITHNLRNMAEECGLYLWLWCPESINVKTAEELINPLTNGLKILKASPKHFEKFNSSNGWGMYEQFISFVEDYLNACIQYPHALVRVSR